LGAALTVGVGGYVHFQIWRHEYRHAPVREMFVANWVVSAILVVALIALPKLAKPLYAAGVLLSAGSLIAFALSRGPGLPTLHGTFKETQLETTASYVFHLGSSKTVLVAEAAALILCAAGLRRHNPTNKQLLTG
jgi:glucan phosphoethanolaminetransferase (alkaline phosphatase superfamily)